MGLDQRGVAQTAHRVIILPGASTRLLMRTALGLLGLLGALIAMVVVWVYILNQKQTMQAIRNVQNAQQQAQTIAGRDEHGHPVDWSITVDGESTGGRMNSIVVTSIIAGGAMGKHSGMKKADPIVEIGPLPVGGMGSAGEAKQMLVDAYQRNSTIVVIRDERRI